MRPVVLLDLTDIPEVAGLFEDVPDFQAVDPRRALRFLHHVAGDRDAGVRSTTHRFGSTTKVCSSLADDGWLRLVGTRHRWFEPP